MPAVLAFQSGPADSSGELRLFSDTGSPVTRQVIIDSKSSDANSIPNIKHEYLAK